MVPANIKVNVKVNIKVNIKVNSRAPAANRTPAASRGAGLSADCIGNTV